jgi:hypothetical protein
MKTYINFILLRTFGIKPKQDVLKLERRVAKTTCNWVDSLSPNEWFQRINSMSNGKYVK